MVLASRKRLAAAAFAVSSMLLPPTAGHPVPEPRLEVLAVRSTSEQVSLVCELRPRPQRPLRKGAVSVISDGARQPIRVRGILPARASVSVVIDASANAADSLQDGGRAGLASFLLQLPSGASTGVIADRKPPVVAAPSSVGVVDDLKAVSDVRSGGARATSDALTLALRQPRSGPGVSPVIVLYTNAPNAGGESEAELGDRLRRANTVLTVVTTNPDWRYWRTVAASTGGFAIAAVPDQAITSFDAVADGLGSRYTVTFPRPDAGVVQAKLRVDTGSKVITAAVVLPAVPVESAEPAVPAAAATPKEAATDAGPQPWSWPLGAGLLVVLVLAGLVLRVRRVRSESDRSQTAEGGRSDLARQPALPGVRVFDVADPAGPREITNLLFEPRTERDARSAEADRSPESPQD
jgi:hypothetical protein